jgi:hypothetical protein
MTLLISIVPPLEACVANRSPPQINRDIGKTKRLKAVCPQNAQPARHRS